MKVELVELTMKLQRGDELAKKAAEAITLLDLAVENHKRVIEQLRVRHNKVTQANGLVHEPDLMPEKLDDMGLFI